MRTHFRLFFIILCTLTACTNTSAYTYDITMNGGGAGTMNSPPGNAWSKNVGSIRILRSDGVYVPLVSKSEEYRLKLSIIINGETITNPDWKGVAANRILYVTAGDAPVWSDMPLSSIPGAANNEYGTTIYIRSPGLTANVPYSAETVNVLVTATLTGDTIAVPVIKTMNTSFIVANGYRISLSRQPKMQSGIPVNTLVEFPFNIDYYHIVPSATYISWELTSGPCAEWAPTLKFAESSLYPESAIGKTVAPSSGERLSLSGFYADLQSIGFKASFIPDEVGAFVCTGVIYVHVE